MLIACLLGEGHMYFYIVPECEVGRQAPLDSAARDSNTSNKSPSRGGT